MPTDAGEPPFDRLTCRAGAILKDDGGWFTATCRCGFVSRPRPTKAAANQTWRTHYATTSEAAPIVHLLQRLGRFGHG